MLPAVACSDVHCASPSAWKVASVYSWGEGQAGCLGLGPEDEDGLATGLEDHARPSLIRIEDPEAPAYGIDIAMCACGTRHSVGSCAQTRASTHRDCVIAHARDRLCPRCLAAC